jgi:chromosome partitioning protein
VRSIGFVAEKGGVGKTTCAVNVSVALAKRGARVLAIDADPQGNLSMILLGGQGVDSPSLFEVLTDQADAADAVRSSTVPGLDILPADGQLADANVLLASQLGREKRLRRAMEGVDARYDFVVVDTSPQRTLVNVNVLNYVVEVYCPVDPGIFGIAGLVKLQEVVAGVRDHLDNRALRIAGLILSRTTRDNLSRDTADQLRAAFGSLVMKTAIPASVAIGEAHARYQAVGEYAPGSVGAKAFEALTEELVNGQGNRSRRGTDGASPVNPSGRRRRAS